MTSSKKDLGMLRHLAVVSTLVAAAACGTTVPLSQQTVTDPGAPGSASVATTTPDGSLATTAAEPGGGTTSGGQAVGTSGTVAAGTSGGPTRGSTGGSTTGTSGATSTGSTGVNTTSALPAKGKGWDEKFVYIGVTTQKDTSRTFASVGYEGIDPGDTEAQANAVINAINSRGGLLGRQVKPIFKDVPLLDSATNPDQYASTVCTFFSQDKPVVAVVNIVLTIDTANYRACLAKAKIPLLNAELTATDQAAQSQFAGFLYTTAVPTWDALAPVFIDRLRAQGYFQGWDVRLQRVNSSRPKIGVLVLDNPLGERIGKTIVRALKARGYNDVVTFAYAYPGNNIGPAVNYFAGNNVTHVLSSDIEQLTFQTNASPQQYFPRYGVTTNNNPQGMVTAGDKKSQIGTVGIGWAPAYDVAQAQDPGTWSTGEKACLDDMRSGKVVNKGRLAVAFALAVCDGLELYAQGAVAGKHFEAGAVRRGLDATGPAFSTAETFTSGLRAGRSFLPGGVRDLAWDQPC